MAAGARWSRASRPRPRPSSSACSCSPCSPSSPSGCCHTAWPVDAQQGRSLDEFILYDWDLLRTLGALNETDYYARVLCVCVSLTVTLRSVLEWCAYEYKGTGSRCSYGGFECWVTFRGPIVSTRRPQMATRMTHTHTKLWTDQGSLWPGQPVFPSSRE